MQQQLHFSLIFTVTFLLVLPSSPGTGVSAKGISHVIDVLHAVSSTSLQGWSCIDSGNTITSFGSSSEKICSRFKYYKHRTVLAVIIFQRGDATKQAE